MLKYFIRIAIRSLLKNWQFTSINISGLALGMACCIIIMLYVFREINYDKHFKAADRISRIDLIGEMAGNHFEAAVSGAPLLQYFCEEIPSVETGTRIMDFPGNNLFESGENKFYEQDFFYADSGFFKVFDYEFVSGDPMVCLQEPYSIILLQSTAEKYFGSKNPIGEQIKINNNKIYTVTAVICDPVNASHFQFSGLLSLSTLRNHPRYGPYLKSPFAFISHNYIMLKESSDPELVEDQCNAIVKKYMGNEMEESNASFKVRLTPLTRIHLHSDILHELQPNGDITEVYLFTVIAFLVLIIATINFVNLSAAKSSVKALEVGIRKIFGAGRWKLTGQFLTETLIISLFSLLLAYSFVEISHPFINRLMGDGLLNHDRTGFFVIAAISVIIIFTGVLAGIYPAMVLLSFSPVRVLKGEIFTGSGKSIFRSVMVIIQFIITIALIAGTLTVYRQIGYIRTKNLGYDPKNIVIIPMRESQVIKNYKTILSEIKQVPGVEEVAASLSYPGNFEQRRSFIPEGSPKDESWMILFSDITPDYLDVMKMELVAGRNFSPGIKSDSLSVIINQTLARQAGWDSPIGKVIRIPASELAEDEIRYKVIGVVKDFHHASLHQEMKPFLIGVNENNFRYLNIKVNPNKLEEILGEIGNTWERLYPSQPFDYFLLESSMTELYQAEARTAGVFKYFSFLAIVIACLGLFGLVTFITEDKTREIGIKKVLGSGTWTIVQDLLIRFLKLILTATIFAIPIAWIVMDQWLSSFAYRTHQNFSDYLLSFMAASLIAILTVASVGYKAASKNPVDAIRYE